MDFIFSRHASERIKDRGISEEKIVLTLVNPDRIDKESECMWIYQKLFLIDGKKYLIRAFVNVCKDPTLIITAYKTSKIDKYEY